MMKNSNRKEDKTTNSATNKCTAEIINKALDEGKTVYVSNYAGTTKITTKTKKSFDKAGIELFRDHNGLEMASGRKYVDISFCGITIRDER